MSNIKCKVSYKFKRIPLQIKSGVVILMFKVKFWLKWFMSTENCDI